MSILSGPTTPMPRKKGRPRIHPIVTPGTAAAASGMATPKVSGGRSGLTIANNPALKKKMLGFAKYLIEFVKDERLVMGAFMEKPCKKEYPTYYEVIDHPIDMVTIEANIRDDRYMTVDDMVGDYRLMFENCRHFNEEESLIVEDANFLEKMLDDKLREISALSVGKTPVKM